LTTPTPSPLALLPTTLCFLDVETTGSSAQKGRVTEVGIIRVENWAEGNPKLTRWSSLINPEQSIPLEIQALTGITPSMVRDAPVFSEVSEIITALCADAIFVAHSARFDYGFIKAEMERCERDFYAKTLCTVRLSQAMFPDRSPHSLDAVIGRHKLLCTQRHRALGDAEVLWEFLKVLMQEEPHDELSMAMKKIMRHPSLPAHLPTDQLERIPKSPGVYKFFGLNRHPLYIGKSIHLRDRVSEHFCVDHRSERGMRLASEIRRIEWEQTAGDFGARLREIELIKTEMPAHNVALRKRTQTTWISIDSLSARILYYPCNQALPEAAQDGETETYFGPFASKASVKHYITELARQEQFCLKTIGFEKISKADHLADPTRPCFNFQIQKCLGACCGKESSKELAARLKLALEPKRRPKWIWDEVMIIEPAADYSCPRVHRFKDWQWVGSRTEEAEASTAMDESVSAWGAHPDPGFDINIYHLVLPLLKSEIQHGAQQKKFYEGVANTNSSHADCTSRSAQPTLRIELN
jgi:DNA polymerase III subunit epsilon